MPPTQPPRTRSQRVLFRLLAVAFGLVVALVVLEVGFRLIGIEPTRLITKRMLRPPDPDKVYFCYPTNPHGEFRKVPDTTQGHWELETLSLPARKLPLNRLQETPWCVDFNRSSQGLRDRAYGPPPPGLLRIGGVGDSFAAGEGVPLELSLFKQIETMLGAGYEVVNAAQSGIDTEAQLKRCRELSPLACSRAIVVFIPNDIRLNQAMRSKQRYINDLINIRQEHLDATEIDRPSVFESKLWAFTRRKLLMRRVTEDTVRWYLDCYGSANSENVQRLQADLSAFAQIPNLPVVFVLFPLLEGLESGYPLAPIHEQVAGYLRQAGIPVLDLAPVFAGQETSSLWVHEVDHHPNGTAQRLAATAIVEWLRREVPQFLQRPAPPGTKS